MVVYNKTKNKYLGMKITVADNFVRRLKGLLGKKQLLQGEGLLLKPSQGVHSIGMRFSIEVIYLDQHGKVLKIVTLAPWKFGPIIRDSNQILELPIGTVSHSGTEVGDFVVMEEHNPLAVNMV